MVTVRTLANRDRDGTEYGTLYLTPETIESDERKWDSLQDLQELRELFKKSSQLSFNHQYFLDNFKRELAFFSKNVDKILRALELTKRSIEINQSRIIDEINSLVLEIQNLSQKNSDPSVHELIESTISDLKELIFSEKKILKEILIDQKLLAVQRTPKKALKLKLTDSDFKITKLMKEQGRDFSRFQKISEYYLKIKRTIIKIIRYGNNPDREKDILVKNLTDDLRIVLDGYKNSLQNEFRIDAEITYSEFKNLGYLKEIYLFLLNVIKFYRKLPKSSRQEIDDFDLFVEYFNEKLVSMKKLLVEIGYWAQQDFKDGKLILDRDTKIIRKLKSNLEIIPSSKKRDFKLLVDKLDSDVPCYYIRYYEKLKEPETDNYELVLTSKVLIGACPNLLKKILKIHPGNLEDIIPTQIYVPSLEVNEFSDNTLIMFPYLVHNYFYPNSRNKKIDIIGSSEDVDKLRESIFYSIYRDFNFKYTDNKFKNINDELNFIKADKEYTFKNEAQVYLEDDSVGRSSLKIVQDGFNILLYVDAKLVKKLNVKVKPTKEKLLKNLTSVKKRSHWINKGKKLKCYILGSGTGFMPDEQNSSKIIHYEKTNIWIDPNGNPVQTLLKEKIHPDVIDAVILTHLHEDHYAGFGSFLKYKKSRSSKFTLITTRDLFDQVLFKFSYLFDNGDELALKNFLKPVFIPLNKKIILKEIIEKNESNKIIRKLDFGLEISVRKNFNPLPSYAFKFSYLDKTILISGNHTIKKFDYYSAFNYILEELGASNLSYQKLYETDVDKALGLWSIAASLRQRSLIDNSILFYNHFSSIAVQHLVELKIPMNKIAQLNNSKILISSYFKTLNSWYATEHFDWYYGANIIIHTMGSSPRNTTPDMILELNRYLRSNSKMKFKFFVEKCSGIKNCFPDRLQNSKIIDIAEKEFSLNKISLLSLKKDKQLQP